MSTIFPRDLSQQNTSYSLFEMVSGLTKQQTFY